MKDENKQMIENALLGVQKKLKAPKNKRNGAIMYRNCADILESVKPLLPEGSCITLSDEIIAVHGYNQARFYVEATATFNYLGETISVKASAQEAETTKMMNKPQATGATSSYARKYALSGLLSIDDTADADNEVANVEEEKPTVVKKETAPKVVKKATPEQIEIISDYMGRYTPEQISKWLTKKGVKAYKELSYEEAQKLVVEFK